DQPNSSLVGLSAHSVKESPQLRQCLTRETTARSPAVDCRGLIEHEFPTALVVSPDSYALWIGGGPAKQLTPHSQRLVTPALVTPWAATPVHTGNHQHDQPRVRRFAGAQRRPDGCHTRLPIMLPLTIQEVGYLRVSEISYFQEVVWKAALSRAAV